MVDQASQKQGAAKELQNWKQGKGPTQETFCGHPLREGSFGGSTQSNEETWSVHSNETTEQAERSVGSP